MLTGGHVGGGGDDASLRRLIFGCDTALLHEEGEAYRPKRWEGTSVALAIGSWLQHVSKREPLGGWVADCRVEQVKILDGIDRSG